MWEATFCHGNDDVINFDADTIEEVIEWAEYIERKKHDSVRRSVFHHKFSIDKEDFKQWGTGYHWLSVKKT